MLLLAGVLWGGAVMAGELPPRWSGRVMQVGDGDTLRVRPDGAADGAPVTLRLAGLDAPELCQPGGREAREALRARVLHRDVEVETLGRDDYRRVLGRVRLAAGAQGAAQDVGAWLVSAGQAWSYRWRGDPGPYAAEERAARAAGRGLFAAGAEPLSPWRFRREQGRCH